MHWQSSEIDDSAYNEQDTQCRHSQLPSQFGSDFNFDALIENDANDGDANDGDGSIARR